MDKRPKISKAAALRNADVEFQSGQKTEDFKSGGSEKVMGCFADISPVVAVEKVTL